MILHPYCYHVRRVTGPEAHRRPEHLGTARVQRSRARRGLAQLTLVEHALCPLDDHLSLREGLAFDTGYFHADKHSHAKFTKVTVSARYGLSAADEFYLWGLLALTFAQPNPSIEYWATPHFCLKQLGCLSPNSKGGANYAHFRAVIRRLAGVTYRCEQFYDPIRREFRDRGFGFLSYDLPLRDDSSRAWRLVWNPLFFEYCRATAGKLSFDLPLYRSLDCASRRMFLLLHKIFYRREESPRFDVWHLMVHSLGFSPGVEMRNLKVKLVRIVERLLEQRVLRMPPGVTNPKHLFEKKGTGSYAVRFHRGAYFEKPEPLTVRPTPTVTGSPLYDPLHTIGFSDARIRSILRAYKPSLVQLWADITLAKIEHEGRESFTRSPEAFFMDSLKHAAAGRRTPPDWWREVCRKEARRRLDEEQRQASQSLSFNEYRDAWSKARKSAFKTYVEQEVGRQLYRQTVDILTTAFRPHMDERGAVERAVTEAERHFEAGFRFPDIESWLMEHGHHRHKPSGEPS